MELIDKEEVLKNDENFAVGLVVQKRERKGDLIFLFLWLSNLSMLSIYGNVFKE